MGIITAFICVVRKKFSDLEMLLAEIIVTEIVLGRKKFSFVAVYGPHHMSADDLELFIQRVELLTDYMHNDFIVDADSGGLRTTRIIRE